MKNLFKWELYKVFRQKSIYFTFFGLLILSTGFTFYQETDEVKQLYAKWSGELTEEKVDRAYNLHRELMSTYPDMDFPSDREWAEEGVYETVAFVNGRKEAVESRLLELEGNSSREATIEHDLLSEVEISAFSYSKGPSATVEFYDYFSFAAVAVMILIGISPSYSKEFSTGTDAYILSSKFGRKEHVWAKILSALLYTTAVVIIFESWNLFYQFIQFGSEGWHMAMQTVYYFWFSPYPLTIAEYHLVQFGLHYMAALAFTLCVLFISLLNKNMLVSFFISASIYFVPYFIFTANPSWKWLEFITFFSLSNIMRVNELFINFETVSLFGFPIVYPVFAVMVILLTSVLCIITLFNAMKKKELTT